MPDRLSSPAGKIRKGCLLAFSLGFVLVLVKCKTHRPFLFLRNVIQDHPQVQFGAWQIKLIVELTCWGSVALITLNSSPRELVLVISSYVLFWLIIVLFSIFLK